MWFQHIVVLLAIFGFWGCEKQVVWDFQSATDLPLVVDGIITNESVRHEIRLSYPSAIFGQPSTPVSGASVVVRNAGELHVFSEDHDTLGLYRAPLGLFASTDKRYVLEIDHDDQLYTAITGVFPVFNSNVANVISLVPGTNDPTKWHLDWTHNDYHFRPAMFKVYLDWSGVEGYETVAADSTHAILTAYQLTTKDIPQLVAPGQQHIEFPVNTKITLKKFSITKPYESYVRALSMETDWKGAGFDAPPGNLPTNINGGAIGFFTACSVISKSGTVTAEGLVAD